MEVWKEVCLLTISLFVAGLGVGPCECYGSGKVRPLTL
jgi:hypothetical protein